MRKIVFFFLFGFSNISLSQEAPSPYTHSTDSSSSNQGKQIHGFWGIPFGSPIAKAKEIILSKDGTALNKDLSDDSRIVVDGGNFAGRSVFLIVLQFEKDKLFNASVIFEVKLEARVIDFYEAMKTALNEQYFVSKKDLRQFKYPYKDGDGHETTAIKLGKARFTAFWEFPKEGAPSDFINLEISENLHVVLTYQDGKLATEAIQKRESKDKQDY